MAFIDCNCNCRCPIYAVIASFIVGVVAAFLQITGTITVAPVFLWVTFGIAIGYLAVLLATSAYTEKTQCSCKSTSVRTLLAGILGTVLFSVILLAVGIIATSIVSAILVGFLLLFFSLIITSSACLVNDQAG